MGSHSPTTFLTTFAVVLFVLGSFESLAQHADTVSLKRATARRISGESPRIDGRIDDAAWTGASFISDFRQKEPVENGEPSERTELALLYDDDALYIGARMHRKDPSRIRSEVTRRDNVANTERIIISLDTYHDRRTASTFVVTAAGGRADYYHPEDVEFSREYSFDPVWEGDASIDASGWTAELRIPFSQLRFNSDSVQTWGMNIDRWIPDLNEDIYWVVVPKDANGWSSRMGEIVGISGVRPATRIELMPYIAGGADIADRSIRSDRSGDQWSARAGADLKLGIGPNLTLDATVNPDFGQVEADPAVVNLSDFESIFDERRPFFVEGAQLLRGTGPRYFYSRRIGAPPSISFAGDFTERPDNTTIIAATKLTGRLASGLSMGMLAAVTERESAVMLRPSGSHHDTIAVAPTTSYAVARLQQEFGSSQSTIGLTATATTRHFVERDSVMRSSLSDAAYTGGLDYGLRFDGGAWDITGNLGGSHVRGDSLAMLRLQRSSTRYFQRPDADYVEVDSSRTSLEGYTASVTLRRAAGRWQGYVGGAVESPEFELNDLGQLGTADDIDAWAGISYYENTPSAALRRFTVNVNTSRGWNFGGVNTYQSFDVDASGQTHGYWDVSVWSGVNLPAQNDGLSRGGPLMGTALGWYAGAFLSTPWSNPIRGSLDIDGNANAIGGWYIEVEPGVSASIGNQWTLELRGTFSQSQTPRQYIATLDGGNDATFGRRYVFSRIDQTSISSQLRVGYAITPTLSLDLYAEPFAATGEFHDYGELPQAGSVDIRRYRASGGSYRRNQAGAIEIVDRGTEFSVPRSDFTYLSLRSNLVLRWEWLRGSTAYLVVQRQSERYDSEPESIRPRDLFDAIGAPGSLAIALKIAYWVPID